MLENLNELITKFCSIREVFQLMRSVPSTMCSAALDKAININLLRIKDSPGVACTAAYLQLSGALLLTTAAAASYHEYLIYPIYERMRWQ